MPTLLQTFDLAVRLDHFALSLQMSLSFHCINLLKIHFDRIFDMLNHSITVYVLRIFQFGLLSGFATALADFLR